MQLERALSSERTPHRRLGQMSAAHLMEKELPDVRYIIPSYIAEGLTLLGGKPKLGKYWLILGCAIAVAIGGYALGSVPVGEGDVLYPGSAPRANFTKHYRLSALST